MPTQSTKQKVLLDNGFTWDRNIGKFWAETGSYSGTYAGRRCTSVFWQLAREKSLVPKCSGIRGNSSENSKGIFQNDIRQFESSRPSQPVWSLQSMSRSQEIARHYRELAISG
jgi:hypothetical protein